MNKIYTVLIVDDDPDDQWLTKLAFERVSPQYDVHFASDGQQGVEWIQTNQVLPDLILLDLNMPFMSGFEVLYQLKQSALSGHIPIIILTTSNDSRDVLKAYELGANSFLVKPSTHQALINLVEKIHQCWFKTIILPVHQTSELV